MQLNQSVNITGCFEMVMDTHFDKSYREHQTGVRN